MNPFSAARGEKSAMQPFCQITLGTSKRHLFQLAKSNIKDQYDKNRKKIQNDAWV